MDHLSMEHGYPSIPATSRPAPAADERPHQGCYFRMAPVPLDEARMQIDIAVRLFGYCGVIVSASGDEDEAAYIAAVAGLCQSHDVPLLVHASEGDARPHGLMFSHRNLRPYTRHAVKIEPGRHVADTIRRLCDHMAPRINDQ